MIWLILATLFWSWSFVATKLLLNYPFEWVLIGRFLGAFFFSIPFLLNQKSKISMFLVAGPGTVLAIMFAIQTWALQFESVTLIALLSSLYVIFTPVVEKKSLRVLLQKSQLLPIIMTVLGLMIFYELPNPFQRQISGQIWIALLVIVSAFFAAIHIVWVTRLIAKNQGGSLTLSIWGHFWTGFIIFIFFGLKSLIQEKVLLPLPPPSWIEIGAMLSLILFSTILAFWLQFIGQKTVEPSQASLIYVLEAPLASLQGYLILGEKLTHWGIIGSALILFGLFWHIQQSQSEKTKIKTLSEES